MPVYLIFVCIIFESIIFGWTDGLGHFPFFIFIFILLCCYSDLWPLLLLPKNKNSNNPCDLLWLCKTNVIPIYDAKLFRASYVARNAISAKS